MLGNAPPLYSADEFKKAYGLPDRFGRIVLEVVGPGRNNVDIFMKILMNSHTPESWKPHVHDLGDR